MSKIFFGIPMHKGDVSATTMQSISLGSSRNHQTHYQLLGLSLLAKNFNMLFISAVAKGFDYFVLHHSDLGVVGTQTSSRAGSWSDILVERLNQYKLAAMSSAVVIKSDNGITSSGILTKEGDPWSLRRTTIRELATMPAECIQRADLVHRYGMPEKEAGALLINSGLLIMDIRNRGGIWREKEWTGFNIYDRIAWNRDGVPQSFTIPEDWNFSIWCHENHVPYAFTKELIVAHCGTKNYMSNGEWGDESDCPRQQMSMEDYIKSRGTRVNNPI